MKNWPQILIGIATVAILALVVAVAVVNDHQQREFAKDLKRMVEAANTKADNGVEYRCYPVKRAGKGAK